MNTNTESMWHIVAHALLHSCIVLKNTSDANRTFKITNLKTMGLPRGKKKKQNSYLYLYTSCVKPSHIPPTVLQVQPHVAFHSVSASFRARSARHDQGWGDWTRLLCEKYRQKCSHPVFVHLKRVKYRSFDLFPSHSHSNYILRLFLMAWLCYFAVSLSWISFHLQSSMNFAKVSRGILKQCVGSMK